MMDAGAGPDLPGRVQSPEERELERKRAELAALEADLVERELELSTLQAELAAFETEYLRVVGRRYAELDEIRARIAEAHAARRPTDDAARAAASTARETAARSAAEVERRRTEAVDTCVRSAGRSDDPVPHARTEAASGPLPRPMPNGNDATNGWPGSTRPTSDKTPKRSGSS